MVAEGRAKKGRRAGRGPGGGDHGAPSSTAGLIPLCHTLMLTKVGLEFTLRPETNEIEALCTVACDGKTGVEMEALTGVTVALLTVYDMCKAVDKRMVIGPVHLVEKQGGKSGDFRFEETK